MFRYFFHTKDGGRSRDQEGVVLASDDAARIEAIRFAGDMLRDDPHLLLDGAEFRVELVDENGKWLGTVIATTINAPPP